MEAESRQLPSLNPLINGKVVSCSDQLLRVDRRTTVRLLPLRRDKDARTRGSRPRISE